MEHKSINDLTPCESNPYLKDVLKFIKEKTGKVGWVKGSTGKLLIDDDTGEVRPTFNAIYSKQKVDIQKYNKLYIGSLGLLFDLNKTEQKVLKYIYECLEHNKDYVVFEMEECKKHCEYSSKQIVYTALAGLIEKGIIARSNQSWKIWINPTIMFNGDRLVLINEFEKEQKEQLNK